MWRNGVRDRAPLRRFVHRGEMRLSMSNWMPPYNIWSCVLAVFAATLALKPAYSEFDNVLPALNYCQKFNNTIKLSDDRAILCFDGPITANRNADAFHQLEQNGFFVIRSTGGFAPVGIILSNILQEKGATVIVYDYCLSACANYFLIASSRTYVSKNAIVAWHGGPQKTYCTVSDLETMKKSYRNAPIADGRLAPELVCKTGELLEAFFSQRGIYDRHIYSPQTAYTKKMVEMAARETANKRKIFWMWNPQNYGDYFKSRIIYESYPASQDNVDKLLTRHRLGIRVFYDPPRM